MSGRACRRAWAAALVITSLLPIGELAAFTIAPPNHQKATREALSASQFNYLLPNGTVVTFGEKAVEDIAESNRLIDIWSLRDEYIAENFHFDDERFTIGQEILLKGRDQIVQQLKDPAFRGSSPNDVARQDWLTANSRGLLGNALHMLQDYYSHSTWVEHGLAAGILGINPALGARNRKLHEPAGGSCSQGAPQFGPLTSGDYLASGVTDCGSICNARPNKCAHGNVLTTSEWSIACPLTPLNVDCGINKDRGFRVNHVHAMNLAKQHTANFVASIFTEALAGAGTNEYAVALAVCQFMGVPDPANTCFPNYSLQVLKQNEVNGAAIAHGSVTSTPAGIDCGATCSAEFPHGTPVVLTAGDTPPWIFVRWGQGGVCSGSTSRTCAVEMTSNRTAQALYAELIPTELSFTSYSHSCYLENGQNVPITCSGVPDPGPNGSLTFHEELHGTNNLIPVSRIIIDGQIANEVGHASLSGAVDAWAEGQWFARGSQGLTAQYGTSVTVASNTLPQGTPVTVRITFDVSLQANFNAVLNEPPFVQWYGGLPELGATATTNIPGQFVGVSGSVNNSDPTLANGTIDLLQQSFVGETIPIKATLSADSGELQAARATIESSFAADFRGPYLIEANGLNVYFIESQ